MKKILILTASFGEGHNAAACGIRDGLAQVAPNEVEMELRDLFAETYGTFNDWVRRSYLGLINRAPRAWSIFYSWLDSKQNFEGDFRLLFALKNSLARLLARFRPEVIISSYPAYPHLLEKLLGAAGSGGCQRIVVITDSITVNAIWYRCSADYFLVPNEQTAAVLWNAGVAREKIKTFGFPVSPKFASLGSLRRPGRQILYMINAGKAIAPELTRSLAQLPQIQLTVTVGRDEKLRRAIENVRGVTGADFRIIGWSEDMPRLLSESHLLIGKAGGATVQEAIAAGCPMIINQIVPGQEEGNARLITESVSGVVALSSQRVVAEVERAFADDAKLWREWSRNIGQLRRPAASLDIARFLLAL